MASSSHTSQDSKTALAQQEAASKVSVLYESQGPMRLYKLNRPKALNALDHEMVLSLKDQMTKWRRSDLCRMILGRGDDRAFCAGGDVKSMVQGLQEGKDAALPFFKDEFELNWLMARLSKPYVSVMDGIVMGGGCGIAFPAPIRIATSRTHFAMPETKIGYAPDVGVNYYLAQLDGGIGPWLAITGQDIFGRAAYELGLATHYVPYENLDSIIYELQQLPNPTLSQISACLSNHIPTAPHGSDVSSKATPDAQTPIRGDILAFLNRAFGQDSIGQIYAELERASKDYGVEDHVRDWASEQKKIMDQRSPTGMAVAMEGYLRALQAKRLDVTLENDISMATAFAGRNRKTEDFVIGVNAVLVTRSKHRPKWSIDSPKDKSLNADTISKQFFDKAGPLKEDRPSLDLQPPSGSNPLDGKSDSTWGRFGKYGLPTELEVEATVEGYAPHSGAFKVTEKELIDRILDDKGESGGPRAAEVEIKIKEIVARLCDVKEGGYLDWKRVSSGTSHD